MKCWFVAIIHSYIFISYYTKAFIIFQDHINNNVYYLLLIIIIIIRQ